MIAMKIYFFIQYVAKLFFSRISNIAGLRIFNIRVRNALPRRIEQVILNDALVVQKISLGRKRFIRLLESDRNRAPCVPLRENPSR